MTVSTRNIRGLARTIREIERSGDGIRLSRGLIMRVVVVDGMAILRAGREGARPGDVEMDVLVRAIEYEYKPLFIAQAEQDVSVGRFVKRFLYWPLVDVKLAWKRPVMQQGKLW